VSRRQSAQLSSRAAPYVIKPDALRDRSLLAFCVAVSLVILGIIGMCQYAALVKFWPYNLEFGLQHYDFNRMDGGGWASYWNSLKMASLAACIGATVIFLGAYVVEKARGFGSVRFALQFLAMMPMAVPGMVLGLAYIFFFNDPSNPFNFLYGTLAILVISAITHFYTVAHLTSATALKQMDPEFESVSMSLKQPFGRTLMRVTVPVCLPAIMEVWLYIFVNAMTTVSAVVFLYSPTTALASIAVLNMDDAGDIAPAAAMGLMIFYTNAFVRIVHSVFVNRILYAQRWRRR
jgi:iron(III) transport system permease protein